ncbi:hypothetical protein L1049_019194 [Liquidambar formosana]|uniref:Uncharacterized protein n=1 Tax=Liquidambar formosana TaxID=63359 RepID=A0AAP0RB62_LIQFO
MVVAMRCSDGDGRSKKPMAETTSMIYYSLPHKLLTLAKACSRELEPQKLVWMGYLTATPSSSSSLIEEEASRGKRSHGAGVFKYDSGYTSADINYCIIQSNFAPVEEIGEEVEVACTEGKIPIDFPEGIYVRNGPNPLFGSLKSTSSVFGRTSHAWVEGEGMLHAVYLKKNASGDWTASYNNRYVESETFKLEKQRNKPSFLPALIGDSPAIIAAYVLNGLRFGTVNKYINNTNVFEHSGKLYVIAENHVPQEIDMFTLETHDEWDIKGAWARPFTSHPKKAPGSGELVIMGIDAMKPHYVVGVISADGKKLSHKVDLKFNRCAFSHEIGITQNYNVIMDYPLTIDLKRLLKGGRLFKYDEEGYNSRFGVMPRYGDADSVRWFGVESRCTLHLINSFEDGSEVVVRGCSAFDSIIPGPSHGSNKLEWFSRGFKRPAIENADRSAQDGYLFSRVYEWRLNMETGEVKERYLTGTDFSTDFPFVNEDFTGLKHKYGYAQVVDSVESCNCGMAKYGGLAKLYFDEPHPWQSMMEEKCGQQIKVEYHKFAENNFCSGSIFVKKHGSVDEDDGWIVSFVHNEETNVSQLYVIDAKKFGSEPVAKITLPQRLHFQTEGRQMASSFAFQVNCSAQRHSFSNNFNHFKTSLSSTFKPFVRELQHVPMRIDVSETIKNTSIGILDAFVDLVFEFVNQPLLPSQRNFAPVEEMEAAVLIGSIEGTIPDDFSEGVYIRNGPNPLFGGLKSTISLLGRSSHTWVEGEGMLHALYFNKDRDGSWTVFYNNKHVQTETFKLEKQRNRPSFLPAIEGDSLAILSAYLLNLLRFGKVNKFISNTNVFEHSGKFYSIAENHLPQEIDIFTLETLGNWDVNGAWNRPFTSHPKRTPGTGELLIMGVDARKPFFEVGVVSADGRKLVHKVDLKFKRSSLCHEIGVTQRYNVIMDFPLTIDIDRLVRGGPLIKYDKEGYARIGIMPRYGDADSIQWFEVEPSCTFHILNCFEDGDEVLVWACRARGSIIPGPDLGLNKFEWFSRGFKPIGSVEENDDSSTQDGLFFSRCYEWKLNMQTGEVKERNLTGTEISMDFPMINGDFMGIRNKYGYTQVVDSIASSISGMGKYGGLAKLYFEEQGTGFYSRARQSKELIKVEYHKFAENTFCTGAAFVPKHGGLEEDDGWIITFVHNEDTDISQVYVIDTKKFSCEPVAKITLPSRVPYGFHGAFMPIPMQVLQH